MSGLIGLWYLIWIAVVFVAGILFRRWYASNLERSQLVFWVIFFLLCPPLAIVLYLILKMLRIPLTLRLENSSHG
jgi:hypothetical protein